MTPTALAAKPTVPTINTDEMITDVSAARSKRPETVEEVEAMFIDQKCKVLDLTFVDVPGTLQHTSKTRSEVRGVLLGDGAGFDGSSIRGFQNIEESDMLLVPDPATAIIDPFGKEKTLSMICDVREPGSPELYKRSPRTIAKNAVAYLKKSGIADTAYFGPEAEFFIFDNVSHDAGPNHASYRVDSNEAVWNSHIPGSGYHIRHKEGYFPSSPFDTQQDIRVDMVRLMEEAGIEVETHHHEVATAGQAEIDMKYATLLEMADNLMRYKYIVRNVARRHGKTATFMPKPIFGDNGSGMHVHQSLWKDGEPIFAGEKYAGLSEEALFYMGGLLKHARALCAICNPTTNSYKRLVPGFEAPVNFIYSARNRSAAIRIPMYSQNPKTKRIEYRTPDATCNPYLAFSAMLMAGLDGIKNKIEPGDPTDEDLFKMDSAKLAKIPHAPANLFEALDALEQDHKFLLEGDVFNKRFLEDFIETKRAEAVSESMRPNPWEFAQYYNA